MNEPKASRRSRLRIWGWRCLSVVGGLTLGLLIGEIVLAIFGLSSPSFSHPDDERGWSLVPGSYGRYSQEGNGLVEINSRGFRDCDRTPAKPEGTIRVAVLGDSFVEAREVDWAQAFTTVLESELDLRGFRGNGQVEVLNFGVRGYGTAQELLTLRCCVWEYDPDIVLLAVFTGNDIEDNEAALDRSSTRFFRPYFVRDGQELVIDNSFRSSPHYLLARVLTPIKRRSRIAQLIERAAHAMLNKVPGDASLADSPVVGIGAAGFDRSIYREPSNDAMREAWRVTENLLLLMRDEVAQGGAEFAVVTLTNGSQVHPDSEVRKRISGALGVADLFYPDRRIRALGEAEGFLVLNLAPSFQLYAEERGVFLHGFRGLGAGEGHWNAEGHRLAGQLIASWLVDLQETLPAAHNEQAARAPV